MNGSRVTHNQHSRALRVKASIERFGTDDGCDEKVVQGCRQKRLSQKYVPHEGRLLRWERETVATFVKELL